MIAWNVMPMSDFTLALVDPRQVVLDRIFRRDDLAVRTVQLVERCIERRGLAASRRPGDQEDPVRPLDELVEAPVVFLAETKVANADLDVVFVQKTHDHRLAMIGGQNTDTDIQVLLGFVQHHFDPAVLRPAFFRDVDRPHDLQTCQNGSVKPAWWAFALDEHAVDAVPDADAVLEGLDVDIAGPQLDRLGENEIDQLDDRRVGFFHPGGHTGQVIVFERLKLRIGELREERIDRLGLRASPGAVG